AGENLGRVCLRVELVLEIGVVKSYLRGAGDTGSCQKLAHSLKGHDGLFERRKKRGAQCVGLERREDDRLCHEQGVAAIVRSRISNDLTSQESCPETLLVSVVRRGH